MTRPSVQPTPPAPSEVEYVRKLSLAILSTLQAKGLLSADEVDAILIAARRAAQGVSAAAPAPAAPRLGAAPVMQVTVQPTTALAFHSHARMPQAEPGAEAAAPETAPDTPQESAPAAGAASPELEEQPIPDEPQATEPPEPLTVEAPSQPTALGPDVVEEDGAVLAAALDMETPDEPETQAAEAPSATERPDARPVTPEAPEVEPPAQTIVIGPDEVAETTEPPAPVLADDLVLDGPAGAKPTEKPRPSVPTFDLKLD
ncbi:hypothetical protein QOL99_09505 [Deinococcus sp. MIMF12]|uniref:Uncharacterized protein n=1 Tax=Deinococcus rhizophilus TaxID=3049544 RepID=A0ABT7JL60_9DEIO|nr:hypothetical protein [Deinococcus rhizophilus]MDL2344389.1 hypothetical protein [Deinococcus rhizophilus]